MQFVITSFLTLRYHWPNGVVPYTIDAAFTSTERAAIASGIEHIHENSCIRSLEFKLKDHTLTFITNSTCQRFVPRNGEADYVDIIPGDGGCYTMVPYRPGGGRNEVGLGQNGCVTLWITVVMLLQALGIRDEHNRSITLLVEEDQLICLLCRPDRDDYVIVNWSNIRDASQYERNAWASDDESSLPAVCAPTGSSGEDLSSCYSGWRVGTS